MMDAFVHSEIIIRLLLMTMVQLQIIGCP
jgi:hypothetical protein